jgi:hypothetical protein
MITRIEEEIARIDFLVGQLLTLSRLEAGEPLGVVEDIDMRDLVRDIVSDANFEAQANGREVLRDDKTPPRCVAGLSSYTGPSKTSFAMRSSMPRKVARSGWKPNFMRSPAGTCFVFSMRARVSRMTSYPIFSRLSFAEPTGVERKGMDLDSPSRAAVSRRTMESSAPATDQAEALASRSCCP